MGVEPEIVASTPDSLSDYELARFRELVVQAGEVVGEALPMNIENARVLVLLKVDGVIRGVAALKRPRASYRKKIASAAGVALPADDYPYEMGYVFIDPALQGRGLSHKLVATALENGDHGAIFATVRTDNLAMRVTLGRAGFVAAGTPYLGKQARTIGLLVRSASQAT